MIEPLTLLAFCAGLSLGFGIRLQLEKRPAKQKTGPRMVYNSVHSIGIGAIHSATRRTAWDLGTTVFAFRGSRWGWSQRKMQMSRKTWTTYAWLLRDAKILSVEERQRVRWQPDWNYYRLRACLKHNLISLPYPDREPPPLGTLTADADVAGERRRSQPSQAYADLEDWPHLNRGDSQK